MSKASLQFLLYGVHHKSPSMPKVTRTVTRTTPKETVDTEKLLLGQSKTAHDSSATRISPMNLIGTKGSGPSCQSQKHCYLTTHGHQPTPTLTFPTHCVLLGDIINNIPRLPVVAVQIWRCSTCARILDRGRSHKTSTPLATTPSTEIHSSVTVVRI